MGIVAGLAKALQGPQCLPAGLAKRLQGQQRGSVASGCLASYDAAVQRSTVRLRCTMR